MWNINDPAGKSLLVTGIIVLFLYLVFKFNDPAGKSLLVTGIIVLFLYLVFKFGVILTLTFVLCISIIVFYSIIEHRLLEAALRNDGRLSVTQGVLETGLPFQVVETTLKHMVKSGYVYMVNNTRTGVIEYVFKEFI